MANGFVFLFVLLCHFSVRCLLNAFRSSASRTRPKSQPMQGQGQCRANHFMEPHERCIVLETKSLACSTGFQFQDNHGIARLLQTSSHSDSRVYILDQRSILHNDQQLHGRAMAKLTLTDFVSTCTAFCPRGVSCY